MARPRHGGRSLHKQYGLHLQVRLALALTLLLGVAQVDFSTGDGMEIEIEPQETVDLQHVQQTRQDRTPPAPPQPAVPQVVPNNEVIEDGASGQRLLRAARAEATSAIEVTPIVSTMPVSREHNARKRVAHGMTRRI